MLLLVLNASALAAQTAPDWKARFLEEAPAAWQSYEAFAGKLQGSILSLSEFGGDGRDEPIRESMEVRQNGCWGVHVYETDAKGHGRPYSVRGRNSRYAFELRRADDSSPWVLAAFNENLDKTGEGAGFPCGFCVKEVLPAIYGRTMAMLLQSPDFTLVEATPAREDGSDLVVVRFLYRPAQRSNDPLGDGTVHLDPARHWLPIRAAVEGIWGDDKGTIDLSFEYADSPARFPMLAKTVRRVRVPASRPGNPEVDDTLTVTYDLHVAESRPESDFMLSAFGLPEPHSSPSRLPWVLGIAGATALVVALLLRRLARQAGGRTADGSSA